MTRLEKVMKDKKEELKKLLLDDYCPRDFGLEDRHGGPEIYCDPATRNCEACWNEEMGVTGVEALCDEMIALRIQHEKLFQNSGMISVDNRNGIHVTIEFLRQMPGEMEKHFDETYTNYPWIFSKEYRNVRFFAIAKEENADEDVQRGE